MATFWLNSSGSNTAPYDTKAKGAHTVDEIRSNTSIAPGDTVVFARGSLVHETVYSGQHTKAFSLIAEDDGVNDESTRPILSYEITSDGPFMGLNGSNSNMTFDGFEFHSQNTAAYDFYCSTAYGYEMTFNNCIFRKTPATPSSYLVGILENDGAGTFTVKNSLFYADGEFGVPIIYPMPQVADAFVFENNTVIYNAVYPTNGYMPVIPIGKRSAVTFKNNIIYSSTMSFESEYMCTMDSEQANISVSNNIWYAWGFVNRLFNLDNYGSLNVDPVFTISNPTLYRLQQASPALGAGSTGNNIGWDQLTAKRLVATTFYVTSAGSNTAPYDTVEKGATQFLPLRDLLIDGDTILVASNIYESSVPAPFRATIAVKSVDDTKYEMTASSDLFSYWSPTSNTDIEIDGLTLLELQLMSPPPTFNRTIRITNCHFVTSQPGLGTPVASSLVFENNIVEFTQAYAAGLSWGFSWNGNIHIRVNNNVWLVNITQDQTNMFYGLFTTYSMDEQNARTSTVSIYNNIIYNKGNKGSLMYVLYTNGFDGVGELTFKNNNSNLLGGWIDKPFFDTNNVTYIADSSNTSINPGFIDSNSNYYLAETSKLRNTGYGKYQIGLGWFLLTNKTSATTVYKVGYYYPNLGQIPSVIE